MEGKVINEKVSDEGAVLPPPTSAPTANQSRGLIKNRVRNVLAGTALLSLWILYHQAGIESHRHHKDAHSNHRHHWVHGLHEPTLRGKKAEKLFLAVPTPEGAMKSSHDFSSVPHLGGSETDFQQAKDMLGIFQREFGIARLKNASTQIYDAGSDESQAATRGILKLTEPTAWIDTYYPILNTPLDRELEIIDNGEAVWKANVEELPDDRDPASEFYKTVGAWHGLSCAGDVTAPIVYVNYGRKEDFDELQAKGIDLTGKIAIARYGGVFRGLKVKAAQEAGAVGALIYSDPRDDGNVRIDNGYEAYPGGPARNPTSVQRGSVQFLSKYPGDPSTPGYPSYPNATRAASLNVPSIPSLPISWLNAKRLLEEIDPNFNFELTGAPSKRPIRLKNNVDTKVTPIWNTMAVIPGHIKSEVVVFGNHRDAWVMGAADPTSGTAAMIEIVKGFGALTKKGWKPLRTILVASWDAEEPGLVGSTEYGEDFADFIADHVVAYINVDVGSGGSRYRLGGSPTLANLMRDAALEIEHPTDANRTLFDATTDSGELTGPGPGPKTTSSSVSALGVDWIQEEKTLQGFREPFKTHIRPLGSGSDYTVFLQRIGVASADFGWTGTWTDPVYHYHSVYDSHSWQKIYGDPGFVKHVAIAKHLGLVLLRLIDTPLLPLNTTQYALELGTYLKEVENIAGVQGLDVNFAHIQKGIHHLQQASAQLDRKKERAAHRLQKALDDLERHHGGHKADRAHKHSRAHSCNCKCCKRKLLTVRNWIKRIFGVKSDSKPCKHHRQGQFHSSSPGHIPPPVKRVMEAAKVVVAINKKLSSFERGFIHEGGIKDREWYRNLVVAPGKWTGYGATTLPALTEAIEVEKNVTLAQHEVQRLSELFARLSKELH